MGGVGGGEIDDVVKESRQGDVNLDADLEFGHSANLEQARTEPAEIAAEALAAEGPVDSVPSAVGSPVVGFVVTSQTCDVVRSVATKPFVEVSPLVEVDEATLAHVRRMKI